MANDPLDTGNWSGYLSESMILTHSENSPPNSLAYWIENQFERKKILTLQPQKKVQQKKRSDAVDRLLM